MIKPKRIFVDSSGWIELQLRGEFHHERVKGYFQKELERGSKFVTSDYVLDESWTRLLTQQSLHSAKLLRSKTQQAEGQGKLMIVYTDETLFERSWSSFVKFADHQLSFTDATIVTIVRYLKIDEVLTLDEGFKKIGLTIRPLV